MDIFVDRCAGIDIGKAELKACVRVPARRRGQRHSEVRTFATTSRGLDELCAWLTTNRVQLTGMESTGCYWKPVFYALERAGLTGWVLNARHAKTVPGRKSDVSDATWLAMLVEHGWLRALARRENIPSLPVPERVGGRYSVLSPVGLLPLAVAGVDIDALLQGAADNAARCRADSPARNPALEIAALCYLLDRQHAKHVSVMMPYVNRMQLFVDWYRQLWAESLGKWDRSRPGSVPAGTLPVRAMGAIDQHSQLQMFLESRHDKFFSFLELVHWEHDMPIPLDATDAGQFPYLRNKSMADVIGAEFRATRAVITQAGHPNMTIRLPRLDAHVLGQLIDLYQRATVYAGLLYGVNPLDQPSVEKGKQLAVQYLREM